MNTTDPMHALVRHVPVQRLLYSDMWARNSGYCDM